MWEPPLGSSGWASAKLSLASGFSWLWAGAVATLPMDGDDELPSQQSTTMTTTVPANTGDCDNEPFILFNVHSSKYSITPQHVETQHPTGFNWLRLVSYTTGLNQLGYNNRTDLNRLYVVQSGFLKLRVQSEPVAVAVAPDQGPKTGLNRTFKH